MASNYVKNSLYTIINRIVSILITFLSMILVARGLGPEGQGNYSLLSQLSRTFFYFFSFGFPVGMVFYFGRRPEDRQKIIKTFLYVYLCISSLSLFTAMIFGYFGQNYFFQGIELRTIFIAVFGIPIWFANSYFGAIYQGLENFKRLNLNAMIQPVVFLFGISFLFFSKQITVESSIYAYLLSIFVNLLLNIYYLKRDRFRLGIFKNKFNKQILKDSYQYSLKSYLGSISEFLIYRVDLYIIAFFLPKSALGLYVIAVNIAERIWIFSESISKVLFSKIVNTKEEKRNFYTIFTLQGAFVVGLLGGALFYVFGYLFISIFFGKAYEGSAVYLYVLIPGVIFQSMGLLMKKILESRGFPGTNAKTSFVCLVINVILNLILIPRYNVMGAAVSTTFAYSLYFYLQSNTLKLKFGIKRREYLIFTPKKLSILFGEVLGRKQN